MKHMDFENLKIAVYVPSSHAEAIRKVMSENGCGHIGNYDCCSFSVKGTGKFRALVGVKPFIGKIGEIEEVEEERIETICPRSNIDVVMKAIKAVHPYETPAIDIYPLLNENQF